MKAAYLPPLVVFLVLLLWLPLTYGLAAVGAFVIVAAAIPGAWRRSADHDTPRRWPAHFVAAAGPVLLAVLLYYRDTHAWWLHDDPAILRQVLEYPLLNSFLDSDTWRAYSAANLTPWLLLSFAADHAVFGLDPWGYYVHQLLAFTLLLLSGYAALLRWLPPILAACVLMAFTASVPVATVMQELMTRHYLEGLLLTLWAVMAFRRGLEIRSGAYAWLAAFLYLLACSAKEIYVPLVVLLPFLPAQAGWRQRILYTGPAALAAGIYSLWRMHMLKPGNVLSGYGSLYQAGSVGFGEIASRLATSMGWVHGGLPALSLLLGLWAIAAWVRRRQYQKLMALVVGLVLVVLPLVPVLGILSARNLLLFSAVLSLLAGLGLAHLAERGQSWQRYLVAPVSLAWVALSVQAVAGSPVWRDRGYFERFRTEGLFVLGGDPHKTLLGPIGPSWYYDDLAWIRAHALGRGQAPSVCYDPCLCPGDKLLHTVKAQGAELVPVDAGRAGCGLRKAPMSIRAEYDPSAGVLSWHLGPYPDGSWSYALLPGGAEAPLPATGRTPIRIARTLTIRILYRSPSGWRTASKALELDPGKVANDGRVHLHWQRP